MNNNNLQSRLVSQRLYKSICELLEQNGKPIEIERLEGLALVKAEKKGKALDWGSFFSKCLQRLETA